MAFEAPDGSSILRTASVVSPLWRLPTSGGEPMKILDGVVWLNFWSAREGVYYIDRDEGETRLQYLDFATGSSTTVARNLGEVEGGLTASPDGEDDSLYSRGLLCRRPDARGELPVAERRRLVLAVVPATRSPWSGPVSTSKMTLGWSADDAAKTWVLSLDKALPLVGPRGSMPRW